MIAYLIPIAQLNFNVTEAENTHLSRLKCGKRVTKTRGGVFFGVLNTQGPKKKGINLQDVQKTASASSINTFVGSNVLLLTVTTSSDPDDTPQSSAQAETKRRINIHTLSSTFGPAAQIGKVPVTTQTKRSPGKKKEKKRKEQNIVSAET